MVATLRSPETKRFGGAGNRSAGISQCAFVRGGLTAAQHQLHALLDVIRCIHLTPASPTDLIDKTLHTMSKDTAILVFRILSGIATTCMVSSPSFLMYRIQKQKHVGVASVFPLAALLANSHVWMMYGYLEDMWFPIFSCFLYGECCAVVFLAVYTYYCADKGYVIRTLSVFITILSLLTIYAIVGGLGCTNQTTKSVSTIIGIFADCAGISLYGAPMEKLFQVLKHKTAVFINVHMVYAGIANNIVWLTYGVLITNWFIIFINVLFITVNTFTMCLYVKYDPKTHPLQDGWDHPDDEQISVTIEMAPHLETKASTKSLTSLPSPERWTVSPGYLLQFSAWRCTGSYRYRPMRLSLRAPSG
ncbi:unnamed protein product [Phytophthora fragariaefolia]|uniref:Unnamed protein product n=1 Tax=Phytophthora fragariaefolia TaxID=1490495 RepID=A0A9W6Y9L4_9STRA|nr:unnamed protein product [Phytophthora fragariaefolia]